MYDDGNFNFNLKIKFKSLDIFHDYGKNDYSYKKCKLQMALPIGAMDTNNGINDAILQIV
jgi:hypothetical protein